MRATTWRAVPGWCVFALALLAPGMGVAGWPNNPYTNVGVCTDPLEQHSPVLAPDGSGGSYIAWLDDRGAPPHRVFAQHLSRDGAPLWTAGGIAVSVNGVPTREPVITTDGAGGAIVAWSDFRADYSSDIRAQRVGADGSALWVAGGVPLCSAVDTQYGLSIVADGAGGAVVGWRDFRSGSEALFAQRVAAAGFVMWTVDGVHLHSEATDGQLPALAATGDGGVIASWFAQAGTSKAAMAQRISGAGVCLWPAGGVTAATAGRYSENPVLTADGQDGAILAWTDIDLDGDGMGQYSVRAQRVSAAGDLPWGGDGVMLCSAPGWKWSADIASDGAGGAVVAWRDRRDVEDDVRVQRVSAAGVGQWLADGVPLEAVGVTSTPRIIADGFGGAIIAWCIQYPSLIFAQRLSASGIPQWSSHGVAASIGDDNWFAGGVIADGEGGAVLAWTDRRNSSDDIYAQGIDGDGRLFRSEPFVTGVNDVPGDQGGRVRLEWAPSNLDRPQAGFSMYGIWRRVAGPEAGARTMRAGTGAARAQPGVYRTTGSATGVTWWEGVDAVVAVARSAYSFVVATAADSCAAAPSRETFMVDYHVAAWDEFWSSAPDSGCSVDNLPPAVPANLYRVGGDLLQWDTPTEPDFHHFDVYGSAVDHLDGTATLLAATPNTQWSLAGLAYPWYLVTASDVHGNASAAAVTFTASATPGSTATELRLLPARPNPFNPRTRLAFTLPQAGTVRIVVFDLAGRAVRTLVDGSFPQGRHETEWDGCDARGRAAASGSYVARLEFKGRVQVGRLELVR